MKKTSISLHSTRAVQIINKQTPGYMLVTPDAVVIDRTTSYAMATPGSYVVTSDGRWYSWVKRKTIPGIRGYEGMVSNPKGFGWKKQYRPIPQIAKVLMAAYYS